MSYSPNVLRRAQARLSQRREERQARQEALRRQVYAQLPRVAEIDRLLRRTMAQVIAAALREGGDPTAQVADIRRKNQALQQERAELLTGHGFPADALDDKPLCAKCGDSGWVGSDMCDCLKVLCTQEQIRELSQLLDLGEQSFDTFEDRKSVV